MRHQKTRHKLSRDSAHRKALLANLCIEVIDHERIKTTEAKAKAVKPEIEQLITLAKRGDLHARRQAMSTLQHPDKGVIYKLFEEIAPALHGAPRRLHADPQAGPPSERFDGDGLPRARLATLTAKLTLEYDGTHFAGWAIQPGKRTVEGELARARCGRCCASDVRPDRRRAHRPRRPRARPGRLLRRAAGRRCAPLNALLPARRRACWPRRRCPTASPPATTPARARYLYRVHTRRPAPSPFERGRALWWPHRVDLDALQACAAALPGEHDFTAFTPSGQLPPALRARDRRRGVVDARGRTTCSSSASRPTPSCAT